MTEAERYAWIQLALTPYIGADSFLRLLQHFGSAQAALQAPAELVAQMSVRGKQAAEAWHNTDLARKATDAALVWEQQEGCRLLLLGDVDYPVMLSEGMTPPPLLFVRGDVGLLQRPAVAMIGSRHATPKGLRIAHDFAQALSEQGITVVSGMALGIDTAAHTGALKGQGSTIAVWGTGIDRIYPPSNKQLAHDIAEQGLIVSEFPLDTRPLAGNFPRRNRLIAAQATTTLVVEATVDSGSLITARLAVDMGRDVMAIPSSIDNPQGKGCHLLIKEGAKLVECVEDIINESPTLLSTDRPNKVRKLHTGLSTRLSTNLSTKSPTKKSSTRKPKKAPELPILSPVENTLNLPIVDNFVDKIGDNFVNKQVHEILAYMGYDPVHPDLIAEKLNIPTDELYARLMEWELEGIVTALSGGRYQRIG